MQKVGMTYRYSYKEQWQPKNLPVIFRMYQLNLNGNNDFVYKKYWDMSDNLLNIYNRNKVPLPK